MTMPALPLTTTGFSTITYEPIAVAPLSTAAPVAAKTVAFAPLVGSGPPTSAVGYSPNIETYSSMNTPYFALASGVGDVSQWATFPAVANVDMSGNAVVSASSVEITSGPAPYVLIDNAFTNYRSEVQEQRVQYYVSGVVKAEMGYAVDLNPAANNIALISQEAAVPGGLHVRADSTVLSDFPVQAPEFRLPLDGVQSAPVQFTDTSGAHLLRSIIGDLYFDNELLAKANDIQDVADWALYPALGDVDVDGKRLYNVDALEIDTSGGSLVALRSGPGALLDISATSFRMVSATDLAQMILVDASGTQMKLFSNDNVGFIGETQVGGAAIAPSLRFVTDRLTVEDKTAQPMMEFNDVGPVVLLRDLDMSGNDISGCTGLTLTTVAPAVLTSDASGNLLVNGAAVSTGTGGNVSQWATFPAVSAVDMALNNLDFVGDIACRNLEVGDSTTGVGDLNLYGANNLVLDNALFVEGGVSMSAAGNVHAIHLGTNTVAGIDTCRLDLTALGVIDMVAVGAITIDAGGAANIAAGGAVSVAGGGYVELNSGEIRVINSTTPANATLVFPAFGGSIEFQGTPTSGGGDITGLASLSADASGMTVNDVTTMTGFGAGGIVTNMAEVNTVLTTTDRLGSTFNAYIQVEQDLSGNPGIAFRADELEARNQISLSGVAPLIAATDPSPIAIELRAANGVNIQNNVGNHGLLESGPHSIYSTAVPADFVSIGWDDAAQRVITSPNGVGLNYVAYLSDIPQVYQAQYYKSVDQNLTSGNTDLTFDLTQPWNNTGGYITHTNGTTDFTVVQAGVYQLEFNTLINANGAVTTGNVSVGFDITRTGPEIAVIRNTAGLIASAQNYAQAVAASYYLEAGDVINIRVVNTFTGGPPAAAGVTGVFDYNTFFTWTYVSSGGAVAYQNPPPVIRAAGAPAIALVPSSANTTYILTSGTTQNFTTAGLGVGNAGAVWTVKNAQAAGGGGNDVNIQANGVAIAGATDVLHQRTNTTNTGAQTLYWNGTVLTMY
jgi:hypothetical protein